LYCIWIHIPCIQGRIKVGARHCTYAAADIRERGIDDEAAEEEEEEEVAWEGSMTTTTL